MLVCVPVTVTTVTGLAAEIAAAVAECTTKPEVTFLYEVRAALGTVTT